MNSIIVVVAALAGPGVAQAYVGRRVAAALFAGASLLVLCCAGLSVYALALLPVLYVASLVHAITLIVRRRLPQRAALWEAVIVLVALTLFTGVIRRFVTEMFQIASTSHAPTFVVDDRVVVTKLRAFDRGDTIVFRQPCQADRSYVMRVVALGNETVEVRCQVLYVNGKAVPSKLVDANGSYDDRDESGTTSPVSAPRYRETIGAHTFDVYHRDAPAPGEASAMQDFPRDSEPPSCARDAFYKPSPLQQSGKIVETAPASDT
ncbi:MAG TPA: signal peptidase I, partial [Kofleriaceae bacterium]|nr:signal peptidase I [Kofleriaceae bacterium]